MLDTVTRTNIDRKDLGKMIRTNLRKIEEHNGAAADLINGPTFDFNDMLDALGRLAFLRNRADEAITYLVRLAVEEDASWRQIGDALGISRQGAQQRYASTLVDRKLPGMD